MKSLALLLALSLTGCVDIYWSDFKRCSSEKCIVMSESEIELLARLVKESCRAEPEKPVGMGSI